MMDDCQRFFDSGAEVGVTGTSDVAGVLTMAIASLGCDSLRVLWTWIFVFFPLQPLGLVRIQRTAWDNPGNLDVWLYYIF